MLRLRLAPIALLFLLIATTLHSQKIGADPAACQDDNSVCTQHMQAYSFVSLTEGNVAETYSGPQVMSAFGPTLKFNLIYNSYNADGTRAALNTVLGMGWTHTYNDFVFTQGSDIFRWSGDGRVTKFSLVNGSYQAAPGYFETLTLGPAGSVTITDKYQTKYFYLSVSRPTKNPPPPDDFSDSVLVLGTITDRNQNVTRLNYDHGLLSSVTDTYGRTIRLTYSGPNQLSSITDPLGRVTTLAYDSSGTQLVSITDPLGKVTTYSYNGLNQIVSKVDRDHRAFNLAYQNNLPYSETDGNGGTVYALTNPSNWATDPNQLNQNYLRVYVPSTTSRTDGRGDTWNYQYDSNGFPLAVIAPDGATTRYTYDPNTLRPASKTDANGNTTTYQYDSEGNLIQVMDANGYTTHYTYDPQFNQRTSMTDPQGRVTRYGLDSNGNRASETDPIGGIRTWTYDSHGNVVSETDKNGNGTGLRYDTYGNTLRRTDALMHVTTYGYDIIGNLVSVTDANNHNTSNKYDSLYRLVTVTDALNNSKQYSYDGEGDKTIVTDENGNATNYAYDQRLRLVKTTDAIGNSSTNSYDADNNLVFMTDLNGHATAHAYDVQNRRISTKDALGHVTAYGYDAAGNKISEMDANGHTTTIVFDALSRKVQSTDALGEVTVWGYDLTGLPGCPQCTGPTLGSTLSTKQTDGNGKVIYWAYDGLDRLIVNIHKQGATDYVITPNDAVNRHAYDANSNHVSMTDAVNNTTTYVYDALNREVRNVNATGDTTTATYDAVGNTASITYPNMNVATTVYDANNRPLQQSDSAGFVGAVSFDPAGNITSVSDGNGKKAHFVYDPLNRLISFTDPQCETHAVCRPTIFTYDAQGNQLSTSDRNGNTETYSYDDVDRPISVTNPLGHTSQSQYDAVGNVTQLADGNGHTTSVVYDAADRPTSETYADPSDNTVAWTYDKVGKVVSRRDQKSQTTTYTYSDLYFVTTRTYAPSGTADVFVYDLAGRTLSETHGGWTDTFAYDGVGRMLQTVQNGHTISYTYDVPGRKRTITYPGGRTITEQKDPRSRISTINDGGTGLIAQYSYDQANNVLARAFRNGTQVNYTYNANNLVLSVDHTLGSHRLFGFQYTYDAEGNPLSQNKLSAPADSEAFARNSIYQLIDYKTGTLVNGKISNPTKDVAYTLDPVGNWDKIVTTLPSGTTTQSRTHSPSNEITSIDSTLLSSDFNGNLTDDGTKLYSYDEENRLIEAVDKTSGHVWGQYQYDTAGRRVSKIDNFGVQTFYYYDGVRTIEEQSASGTTLATYVFGNYLDEVLTMDRDGQALYYHQNALHSVFGLSNSTGNIVEAYDYDAYGAQTVILPGKDGVIHFDDRDVSLSGAKSSYGNPFLFTGQRYDPETGLMYYKQRYYSATLGRFMTRDPIGIWDDLKNLGNGYAYVGDNPATWDDPYGTKWGWLKKIGQGISNVAHDIAKAVAKIAKTVAYKVVSTVASVIGEIDNVLEVAEWIGKWWLKPINYFAHFNSHFLDVAFRDISHFLDSTFAKVVFGAAACVSFASDVIDTIAHGLQPDPTATKVLSVVGIKSNTDLSVVTGDITTVANDALDGIGCAEWIFAVTILPF